VVTPPKKSTLVLMLAISGLDMVYDSIHIDQQLLFSKHCSILSSINLSGLVGGWLD